jgi:hypothetical protein
MSLTPVGRTPAPTSFPFPARTAPGSWSAVPVSATALARVIQPVRGSAAFLAQHLAQEVMAEGAYVPRWRERDAAYAAPSAAASYDLSA